MTKHSATATRPHNSRFLLLRSVARRSNLTGNSLNATRRYSTVRSRRPLRAVLLRADAVLLRRVAPYPTAARTSCLDVAVLCVCLCKCNWTTRHDVVYRNAIWRWGIGLLAAEMKTKGVEISDEDLSAARDSLRRAQEGCGAVLMREVVLAQQTLS